MAGNYTAATIHGDQTCAVSSIFGAVGPKQAAGRKRQVVWGGAAMRKRQPCVPNALLQVEVKSMLVPAQHAG